MVELSARSVATALAAATRPAPSRALSLFANPASDAAGTTARVSAPRRESPSPTPVNSLAPTNSHAFSQTTTWWDHPELNEVGVSKDVLLPATIRMPKSPPEGTMVTLYAEYTDSKRRGQRVERCQICFNDGV